MVPDQRAEILQGEARDADKRQCDHRLHRQTAGGPGDGDFLEHRSRAAFVRLPHEEVTARPPLPNAARKHCDGQLSARRSAERVGVAREAAPSS
jgi:hypothetical protein